MERNGTNKIIAGVIVIIAVALIAIAASALTKKEEQQTSQSDSSSSSQEQTTTTDESPITSDSSATYKDGTYTVSDTYPSPGGEEDIKVVLTVSNNLVSAVEVTQQANQRESAEHQQNFQDAYKSKAIGKALSTLDLSRISGASLTTNAFNDALDQIRDQAAI